MSKTKSASGEHSQDRESYPQESHDGTVAGFDSTMFEMAPIGMLLYRPDGSIKRANSAVCKLLGYTETELTTLGPEATFSEDRDIDVRIMQRLVDGKDIVISERKRFVRSTGDLVHVRLKVLAKRDDAGKLTNYLVQIVDVTERQSLRAELARLGRLDLLTRLPNRHAMLVILRQAITRVKEDTQVGFLFINVDRFQIINDALGPKLADQFLLTLASRLRGHTPAASTLGRLGGDEFGVILPLTDARQSVRLASRLVDSMREPFTINDHTLAASISIGISCMPKDGETAEDLLRHAGLAMHQAKLAKSGYQLYSDQLDHFAQDWLITEARLIDAIRRESFELEFQPIHNASDHATVIVEALVRWRDGDTLVQPGAFIPIAEATGVIRDIDALVVAMAIRNMADNIIQADVVSVNLSPISLRDNRLLERIRMLLSHHGLDGSSLVIEITETALITDYAHTKANIDALRSIGIRFAIDDFGAGYTSLALLRSLDVDLLKIDRTFIEGIGERKVDETIIGAMIDLGREMHIQTIAEGVETIAQRDWLRDRGCNLYQGFVDRITADTALQEMLPDAPTPTPPT